MKNKKSFIGLFSGLIALIGIMIMSSYAGRPLFGTTPNQDNTGRQVTYGFVSINDTAGTTPDTITIVPEHYEKYYTIALKDSTVIAVRPSTNSAFTCSKIHFIINASSTGSWVKFLGYSGSTNQWLTSTSGTSKFTVTPSHTATISFICTGTAFAELYRSQD